VSEIDIIVEKFGGECSDEEIERLADIARKENSELIAGLGGGKTLDTAKAIAHELNVPAAVVPTLASTDAPCSALAVIYTAEGSFKRYLDLPKNADLIGGRQFEPDESNPMLGFRGASRYYSDQYKAGFAMECGAIKRVREELGLVNVVVMIPFCRTPQEADKVYEVMAENKLIRGQAGLEVYVMAEVPSNIILAKQFADRFDGFSIGSNDLTQLVLGVDRDTAEIVHLFDERNDAVKEHR
jgi:hypothetical protein